MEIFVSNIPFNSNAEEIRELFAPHGTVGRVNIITDRETGRSRGFGFVEMPNANEAKDAIAALNGYPFHGRNLTVNEARPRAPRPTGGGRNY